MSKLLDLGFVFKFSLYTLTAMVGLILGYAESEGISVGSHRGILTLPFASIPLVICGFLYTEQKRRRGDKVGSGLNPLLANLLGLAALGATIYEFTRDRHEAKLLAGTHLLLYATWIVLFQKKTVRLYWFLMALGILQIAVASVLTTKGWFGFCALAYMFGAVWTLSIFSLWRAEQEFDEEEKHRFADSPSPRQREQVLPSALTQLPSEVRSAVQHEDGTQWLTGRFVTGVLLTSCSALLVSAAFFAFVPRVWVGTSVSINSEGESIAGLGRKTGLASTVQLGSLGPILESMERVFEIQLKNQTTKTLISAQEYAERLGLAEPLFRASVLIHYENGRWAPDSRSSLQSRPFQPQFKRLEIEQTIRLDSTESGVLFCLGNPLIMVDSQYHPVGELNELTGVATIGERRKDAGSIVYNAYTTLPSQMPQYYEFPVSPSVQDQYSKIQYFNPTRRLPSNLKRLKELTSEIIERETERRQKAEGRSVERTLDRLEIATALEAYLRDSGEFTYSLDLSIQDPTIDPILDFLFNRKEGHCEYFATALALMLRAAKIPSRLVSGYKGGIVRSDKKDWLEVQQRFAHVWVEAWVNDRGWTTFDATPSDARSLSVLSIAAKRPSMWTDMQSTLAGLWSDNILNMSLDRQEESIYKPLRQLAFRILNFLKELWTSPASALSAFVKVLFNRDYWFSVGGALAAISVVLFLAAVVWFTFWLIRGIRAWLISRANRRIQRRHRFVEFYERFMGMMQARGMIRLPNQTQQEFAEAVTSAYSPEFAAMGLVDIPRQISNLFYQVRFGEQDLTETEASRIDDLLSKLEHVLSNESK